MILVHGLSCHLLNYQIYVKRNVMVYNNEDAIQYMTMWEELFFLCGFITCNAHLLMILNQL